LRRLRLEVVASDESIEIMECLEGQRIAPPLGGGARIVRIRHEPTPFASSYRAEVIVAELTAGEELRVFLKDFGTTFFPKDAGPERRERELHVYRDLLVDMGLGTPQFYGSLWNERSKRFLLLLEYVDGLEVRDCPLDGWISAARWVGRLHGTKRWLDRLEASSLLVRHDEVHFLRRAELAVREVAEFGSALEARLRRVVDSYGPVVEAMVSQPVSLVHGGYWPANVLLAEDAGTQRVCAIDWELAALGSPLYDLATLVDGFTSPELAMLLDAYVSEALAQGASVPEQDELRRLVQCFLLARVINTLARVSRSRYRKDRVTKLVAQAEKLHRAVLGQRGETASRDGLQ